MPQLRCINFRNCISFALIFRELPKIFLDSAAEDFEGRKAGLALKETDEALETLERQSG